jgi:anti-anti-sigma factor
MTGPTVDVNTTPDGTVVIKLHGVLDTGNAVELRRTVVRAVRHTRPRRMVIDLNDVADLDPINVGSLAAACHLGDDHDVVVFVDHSSSTIADRLIAAGRPRRPAPARGRTGQPPLSARRIRAAGDRRRATEPYLDPRRPLQKVTSERAIGCAPVHAGTEPHVPAITDVSGASDPAEW